MFLKNCIKILIKKIIKKNNFFLLFNYFSFNKKIVNKYYKNKNNINNEKKN